VLPRALTLAPRELSPPEERGRDQEIAWAIDRDYWLSRCQGFAVEEGDHCIGQVDAIEYQTRIDAPDWIVVRTGRFMPRTERVPVGEVDAIWPTDHALVLHRRTA
jgi:hypothetical protein